MVDYQFVGPKMPGGTLLDFKIGATDISVETGIKFSEALVLSDLNEVYVFQSDRKSGCGFVGRVFSLSGNRLYDIPFPDLGEGYSHIDFYYSWASISEKVIKIIFHTDSVSYGDFWADFDLVARRYGATGPSR